MHDGGALLLDPLLGAQQDGGLALSAGGEEDGAEVAAHQRRKSDDLLGPPGERGLVDRDGGPEVEGVASASSMYLVPALRHVAHRLCQH